MNKIKRQVEARKEFIKLSVNNPKEAAKLLTDKAQELADTKELGGTIRVLSDLLYLCENTIYNECAKR